ncbi:MAG TPA: hypothetical protein VFJ51_09545 [Nitrososphaeraceae archaeon]|nr:hypothetical protein [Nitrososphaeraceae archaeon]
MASEDVPFLESDRIIFKLYACKEHLKNLKYIKSKHGDLLAKGVRINAELETDSFILQLNSIFDSLFLKINDKLQLDIPKDKIDISRLIESLSAQTRGVELAHDLEQANYPGNLYWMIKQLRNYSLGGSVLAADPSLLMRRGSKLLYNEVIPYFEYLLLELKNFIENFREKALDLL